VIITQRLGFVSDVSAGPVLRATDELARMLFRMRERVMRNIEVLENAKPALRSNQRL
jgi:hypothetical protein